MPLLSVLLHQHPSFTAILQTASTTPTTCQQPGRCTHGALQPNCGPQLNTQEKDQSITVNTNGSGSTAVEFLAVSDSQPPRSRIQFLHNLTAPVSSMSLNQLPALSARFVLCGKIFSLRSRLVFRSGFVSMQS